MQKNELPKLRKRAQQTITSVLALRDYGINLNYPLKILTALYDDLGTELDASHNPWETFNVPPKEWREKLEDSISLYARRLVGRTSVSALDESYRLWLTAL